MPELRQTWRARPPRQQEPHASTTPSATSARMRDVGRSDRQGATDTVAEISRPSTPANRSHHAQQAIQERIKDWILDKGLESGDPMPTEAELVDHLGVSRNSVREALKALQALRIIEIRHGFGTYVGDCSLDPFADALVFRGKKSLRGDRHELKEIVDLRQALEIGLVGQLVATIDDTALARLRTRLTELEQNAGQGPAGDAADRAFHDELYAALGNQLMSQLLRVFWDVYYDLSHELPPVEEDGTDIVEVHRAIYEAVADRDATRAAAAVDRHFLGIRNRIST